MSSHKSTQYKHYETIIQHSKLAAKMHLYAIDKINQYYLIMDSQVQGQLEGQEMTTRRQKRMMLQKLTIV